MTSSARRLGATVLLSAALAVGGLATAATASAAETQTFTGFQYSPSGEAALLGARYDARQQATGAGYDPGSPTSTSSGHGWNSSTVTTW